MQTITLSTLGNKEMSTLTNQSNPGRTNSSGTRSRVIGESSRGDMLVTLTRQSFDLSVISTRIIDIDLYFITVISDWLYRCIQFDIQSVSQSYWYNRVSVTYCKTSTCIKENTWSTMDVWKKIKSQASSFLDDREFNREALIKKKIFCNVQIMFGTWKHWSCKEI